MRQASLHWLTRLAPGLDDFLNYPADAWRHDLIAGLSVAAVAIPVGVAYAALAGFTPAAGLYSAILPMLAYAVFGSSRQLMVGPDAATCAMIAAALTPLAAAGSPEYQAYSLALTFLVGLLCLAASRLKLGVLADFLSRPILTGFLNGIALSIILGQLGKLFGFPVGGQGIVRPLLDLVTGLPGTHLPTFAVGLMSFAVMFASRRWLPRLPAALIAMAAGGIVVAVFRLDADGVRVIGLVPAGLPPLAVPRIDAHEITTLFGAAAGIALVSFSSAMLTARSFASRNGYEIDPDRDFAALGAANIGSSLLGGFAISGADSRTAMNDAAGGRTRLVGVIAAATVALALLFFTAALQYVPIAALGAVLVFAGASLFDLSSLRMLWRLDRHEFWLAIATLVGVVAVGVIDAIVFAVVIALMRFVRLTARPPVEVLGEVAGMPGLHATEHHPDARTIPGLLMFRFNAPLVFFNAPYFKQQVNQAVRAAGPELRWFVIDLLPVSRIDVTGLYALAELRDSLAAQGVALKVAARSAELTSHLVARGVDISDMRDAAFPTLRAAIKAYRAARQATSAARPQDA